MSGAHAFAEPGGPRTSSRRFGQEAGRQPSGRRSDAPGRLRYVERALLLWPRLDRARLLRAADDPRRIAEIVSRRTIHSVEMIVVMLERDTSVPTARTEMGTGFESGPVANARATMKLMKHDRDEGHGIPHRRPA